MIESNSHIDGSRIVESLPGRGTGDIVYRCEDGRCWEQFRGGSLPTGTQVGYWEPVSNGRHNRELKG
jgi:hypothetical protein